MIPKITRREAIAVAAAAAGPKMDPAIVERHDKHVDNLLKRQITDPKSPWCGSMPDDYGLHPPGSAGGIYHALAVAYLHSASRHHDRAELLDRMRLAAGFLERSQSKDGFLDLLTTNFNSPPDTGFVIWNVAQAALIARRYGRPDITALVERFLKKAGDGLTRGGVHTPNHRWVICSALAQIHALWPDDRYVKRIDQWLSEGIDIDADGQYTERSTLVYNMVCNRSFIHMASKLGRPELLDPVRQNLESLLYLLHPGHEVVTEISRRQDLNTRGTAGGYWLALAYMAAKDRDGRFAALAREFEPGYASLGDWMEFPELSAPLPPSQPLPEDFEKHFPSLGVVRIRRKLTSATIMLNGSSLFFTLRRGGAVINGLRFASAFFGKGQFVPQKGVRQGESYVLTQSLEGPYYQPLDPPRRVAAGEWGATRPARRQSEVCRLTQTVTITETRGGFRVRVQSAGTANVPLAVEISFREGGKLSGCEPVRRSEDCFLLKDGWGEYRAGSDSIRFGPGCAPHSYVQVRGAEPKLPGTSVYLTGLTPFDHTLEFNLE